MPQPRPLVIPRWIVGALMAVVVILGGASAWQLAQSQSDSRESLRNRFADRAPVATAVVDGLFNSIFTGQAQDLDPKVFGAPEGGARGTGRHGACEQERLRDGDRYPRPRAGRVGPRAPPASRAAAVRAAGPAPGLRPLRRAGRPHPHDRERGPLPHAIGSAAAGQRLAREGLRRVPSDHAQAADPLPRRRGVPAGRERRGHRRRARDPQAGGHAPGGRGRAAQASSRPRRASNSSRPRRSAAPAGARS